MNRRALLSLLSFGSFIIFSIVILLLANGYRIDRQTNQVYPTGILEITSQPSGATLTVNGRPRGATNTTLTNLDPGSYSLTLAKEGYTTWQKDVQVDKNKVITIAALLVPTNPSLAPLTSTPAEHPLLSPDSQKLIYAVTQGSAPGIWMLDLTNQPFNLNQKPVQLLSDTENIKYSAGQLQWSPASRDLLITLNDGPGHYYRLNTSSHEVENIDQSYPVVMEEWTKEASASTQELAADLNQQGKDALKDAGDTVVWSPDNLKFLYHKKENDKIVYYVYNKEAKRQIKTAELDQNTFSVVRWYADSQHLIMLDKERLDATSGTVHLMGMDGTNKYQVYNGTLIGDTLYSYLNGAKLIILTSFNLQNPTYYLYALNLR